MKHMTLAHNRIALFALLLAALAVAALSLGLRHSLAQSPQPSEDTLPVYAEARVNVSSLNLRTGPHVSYTAVAYLMDGERVRLVGRNRAGTWAQVELYNGYRGWVNARYLQPGVSIAALPVADVSLLGITGFVTNDPIAVFAGPDVLYQRVGVARPGEVLALNGRNDAATWVHVYLPDGRAGWVKADSPFLTATSINDLPIITPFLDAPPSDVAAFYRVYVGPGFLYQPVDTLVEGQSLGIRGRTADARWVLVRLEDGREGWIAAEIIQVAVPLEGVPVIEGIAPPQVVGWQSSAAGAGSSPATSRPQAGATATDEPPATSGTPSGGKLGEALGTVQPTGEATVQPTATATPQPTEQATDRATAQPTERATARATSTRPATPTPAPTVTPAASATNEPVASPTATDEPAPTATTVTQATTDAPPTGLPVVYVYATPTDDNAPILRVVPGQSVVLIGRTADSEWIQIWLPGDQQGWIRASAVQVEIDLSVLPVVEP